jgi:hypothetical protein
MYAGDMWLTGYILYLSLLSTFAIILGRVFGCSAICGETLRFKTLRTT